MVDSRFTHVLSLSLYRRPVGSAKADHKLLAQSNRATIHVLGRYMLIICSSNVMRSLSPLVRGQDARGHKAASSRRGTINRCEREGQDGLNTGSPPR